MVFWISKAVSFVSRLSVLRQAGFGEPSLTGFKPLRHPFSEGDVAYGSVVRIGIDRVVSLPDRKTICLINPNS
jgi:hypothetical protein